MASSSFLIGLAGRVAALMVATLIFGWSVSTPGLAAARLVALALVAAATLSIWRHARRTNDEVARFIEALRFGDLQQGFGRSAGDSGFASLGAALEGAMQSLRHERGRLSEDARFHAALVEAAPSALLTVQDDDRVFLVSKAARRLFGDRNGVDAAAFAAHGEAFAQLLVQRRSGRRVVPLTIDGTPQRAMVSVIELARLGRGVRLVAVSLIGRELAAAEIAAQSDLVRVLTHEIMNSLTPVTSLAHSAAGLLAQTDADADARNAVETLARRADALMDFVESYRQFARVPEPHRVRFQARPWAEDLRRLLAAAPHGEDLRFSVQVEPPTLAIDGDPDLLAQAAINLLKNAAEAASGHAPAPEVRLSIAALTGGNVLIAVDDNGPGVSPRAAEDMFLPFFTTKPRGTGVGLSVARQIVVAHGGTIRAERSEALGGASLRVTL